MSVDLLLNKTTGQFYADVGGKRVTETTKEAAVKKVRELLAKITQTVWYSVILLRVDARSDDGVRSWENSKAVLSASCSFTYLRRERAKNPLKPKELIEREHPEDFEKQIVDVRKRATPAFGSTAHKRAEADAAEKNARDQRDALAHVEAIWTHYNKGTKEYELPYSPEAWAGIERIAQALRETQAKLDQFAKNATPDTLAKLAAGDVLKQLPPAKP
jgi:hypothetical protein